MAESCEHIKGLTADNFPPPKTLNAGEECLVEGSRWVSLHECQSSATRLLRLITRKTCDQALHDTHHPVMRALPPASWTWCYVHEITGSLV